MHFKMVSKNVKYESIVVEELKQNLCTKKNRANKNSCIVFAKT